MSSPLHPLQADVAFGWARRPVRFAFFGFHPHNFRHARSDNPEVIGARRARRFRRGRRGFAASIEEGPRTARLSRGHGAAAPPRAAVRDVLGPAGRSESVPSLGLSKIRKVIDTPGCKRIVADRKRVLFDATATSLDIHDIEARLGSGEALPVRELEDMAERLSRGFLEDSTAWVTRLSPRG